MYQWASRLWELGRLGGLRWRTSVGSRPRSLVFSPPPFLVIQDLLTNVKSWDYLTLDVLDSQECTKSKALGYETLLYYPFELSRTGFTYMCVCVCVCMRSNDFSSGYKPKRIENWVSKKNIWYVFKAPLFTWVKGGNRTSLVVKWIRIYLSIQGIQVGSLV